MSRNQLQLALIVGSTRRGRFCGTVADWFTKPATQHGAFAVDRVDLSDLDLPVVFPDVAGGEQPPEEVVSLRRRLGGMDAFVVITPEYNHGYPASLKNAIDWIDAAFRAKPVGLVSYGGIAGGTRAAEQPRQVFPELHAMTIRDTVSFSNFWDKFDSSGEPLDTVGCDTAAKKLLDQLAWWAQALREARENNPYT